MKVLPEKVKLSEDHDMNFTTGQGCHSSGDRSVILMYPEQESDSRMSFATRIGFGHVDKSQNKFILNTSDKKVLELKEVQLSENMHTGKKHRLR